MKNQTMWRLSAIATALIISGNAYANQTYHFSEKPNNSGTIEVITDKNTNEFQLSDLTANTEGHPVDAVNSGKMMLTIAPTRGDARASGVLVKSGTFTNKSGGSVVVSSTSQNELSVANGLQASDAYWSTIRNQGSVDVTSKSHQGDAQATGINAGLSFSDNPYDRYGDHMALINEGKMTVVADAKKSATAQGIYTNSANGLTNNGELNVHAQSEQGIANASGLHTIKGNPNVAPDHNNPSNPTHVMTNNGQMNVSASGKTSVASGIYTEGDNVIIRNNGTINVDAQAEDNAKAYGINVVNGQAVIQSQGRIFVSTSANGTEHAYEVMADGSVVNIESYMMTLGSENPWAVSNGGSIVLGNGNKGADLIFMPGQKEDGFEYGKGYALDSLAYDITNNQSAMVNGEINTFSGINQDFKVIHTSNGSGDLGTATLVYAPNVSHAGVSALVQRSSMTQASNIISSRLNEQFIREGCNEKIDANNCMFITPYAGDYRRDQVSSGYSGHRYGVLLGQDHQFETFNLGWHGGYEKAKTSFNGTSDGRKEDVNTFMLGMQGGMTFENDIFATATTTWFRSKTDYTDSNHYSGIGSQSADYVSNGLYTDISTGKSWDINRNYKITPMLGVTHIWQQREGYTVSSHNADYDLIDTHYKNYNGQALMVNAKLRFDGRYPLTNETLLKPYLNLGIHQTLYGDEIKIDQQVPNANSVRVTTKDKSTSGSFDAGMSLVSENGFTSDVRISGEANSDRTDYTGWVNIGYSF
ncbi:autotransporter domain-containing protein [Proteus sp. G2669]|uniref:autotransporter outer membrane beta-barrel domain-containing protein n=1 Tax=Proteus sp. G2669 TaxID=2698881 RepID=UPI0014136E49|nr:autotransporter outer membrane beta-barrel domain-containing protein [Proteus sp. G2669]NBM54990.1 autotransporter domain-containing protein [Proteus sp. G2669]